jgi:WD40 repeat protein/serine/threonine protein kinase
MNERSLFLAALEIPDPAARAAYLDQACAGDPSVRRGVEDLLAAHGRSGSFMPGPAGEPATGADLSGEGPGSRVGPYKLLQQIGEGGMGVVYMAEQEQPVRRKVALKIIKPGMDSKQVVARFEAERQALAMMDHQNIAKVFDAGTTDSGRPFFVMELVHGVPITDYCDANKLTPRERLELFVPVCQAIQHAHQKGIIHRDVKPSNVLVTMYDDKPVPKVIDFGVAKAVEQRLTEKTLFTQFGALVGTFEYMSPEQAEMNAFGVDTRSDIYALGVLLYELLTGTTPLERSRLRSAALNELVRLIKEEEAPRPSVRLSTSSNLPKIAAARKTEPAQLSKLVRGEIDWIVMKCLEKDRSRRYDSASGLARDVERHLADEPVEACPPSAGYRLAKFVRKYKKILVSAAAFVALLVASVVVSTALAVWATSAEREANRHRAEAVAAKVEADAQRDRALVTSYAAEMGLAMRAWEEENVIRVRELLNEVPREVGGRNLRGFEWDYLNRLCNSELRTLHHAKGVTLVAFHPDGRRVAAGDYRGMVKVWDIDTGKELFSVAGHREAVIGVAFSPDGQRLATVARDDPMLVIWDSATGKKQLSLGKGSKGSPTSVAFSPDGKCLAIGGVDGKAKLLDCTTGEELPSFAGQSDASCPLAFSPDGQRVAFQDGDTSIKIWDRATGKELHSLEADVVSFWCAAFSPDGRLLAAGSDPGRVYVWDSMTGKQLLSFEGDPGGIGGVAFSPDGKRFATGGENGAVKFWDSATGKLLARLQGHTDGVRDVAFSPDGRRLVSGSSDSTVKVWDTTMGQEPFSLPGHTGDEPWVRGVAFSPDGRRLYSVGQDKTVKIWDAASGTILFSLTGHTEVVRCLAVSPDGQTLATGSSDKTVKLWDTATGQQRQSLTGHTAGVLSVAFSPDGRRIASGDRDKTLKFWDTATGQELLSLIEADTVESLAFSPDGRRLAVGSNDITIRDGTTGQELLRLTGHTRWLRSVVFSPDGKLLASGSQYSTAKIWDAETGQELFTLRGHAGAVSGVAFSPDGRRLATGGEDQRVRLWDTATGKEVLSLKGHAGAVWGVAFSPDGKSLAAANEKGSLSLWETSIPEEVRDRRAAKLLGEPRKPSAP